MIQDLFRQYYAGPFQAMFQAPPRHARREYGFIHFAGKFFDRHRSFISAEALKKFIVDTVPQHCYHSAAYYDRPGERSMKDKDWRGADLIFDLDADHLPGAALMSYDEMLAAVKVEVIKLVSEYLAPDLGLDPHKMEFVFSGGRGYHIHVRDERLWDLDAACRREIVSYVTGKDVKLEDFLHEHVYTVDRWGKELTDLELPPAAAPGWKGRLTRAIVERIESAVRLPRSDGLVNLQQYDGIGPKIAAEIYDTFADKQWGAQRIEKLRKGQTTMFNSRTYLHPLVKSIGRAGIECMEADTDEPVTSDTKRLIRMPWTLHGKTGLLVLPLRWEDLPGFDPLKAACILDQVEGGCDIVKVRADKPFKFTLRGDTFEMISAGESEMPRFAAVFAVGRKLVQTSLPLK